MQHYFLILEMQAIGPLDALVLPKYNTYIERFMKAQRLFIKSAESTRDWLE